MGDTRLHIAASTAVLALALWLAGAACAPRPRNVPCTNDAQCAKDDSAYRYCLESRCVECVGDSACAHGACVDGRCVASCKSAADCPSGRACEGGVCAR